MLDSCARILRYTAELDFEDFTQNDVVFDAVVRRLQVIGEAAARIPPEMRERHPQIEWRKIVGLRNIMVHQYASVDEEILWDVVRNSISDLQDKLHRMLESQGNEGG